MFKDIDISLRKLSIGIVAGSLLSLILVFNVSEILDFFFIRWQYMIPPLVAIYYLSVQPYLNYADHKTYFKSGAYIGILLALVVIGIQMLYEFAFFGELQLLIETQQTLLSYILFTLSYAVLTGLGHYLFNINVDEEKKDIYRSKYLNNALLLGGFTFIAVAVLPILDFGDTAVTRATWNMLVPIVIGSYITVKLHGIKKKQFFRGTVLGALTGFGMAVLLGILIGINVLIQLAINPEYVNPLANENLLVSLVTLPLILIVFTIIGGWVGLTMKALKTIL